MLRSYSSWIFPDTAFMADLDPEILASRDPLSRLFVAQLSLYGHGPQ